jgi:hypothetical protein
MRIVVKCISRSNEKSKELLARNVAEPNTIGFKVSGNGNVQNVVLELP